jgi:iron(III) transport system permease protein
VHSVLLRPLSGEPLRNTIIVGYAWHSLSPGFIGLRAAAVAMTLDLYPLVYLPVAAALRRTDPRAGGDRAGARAGRARFRRVIFPQIRPALLGGTLVVGLALLAEFGAFEILDFRTFTTEIFAELKTDQSGAAAPALLLVTLGIVVLLGEAAGSGRRRIRRSGPQAPRPPGRVRLGRWRLPVLAGPAALVVAALGVPVGTLGYWLAHSHTTTPASTTLLAATAATARYSAAAAALATAVCLRASAAQASPALAEMGRSLGCRPAAVFVQVTLPLILPGVGAALCLVFLSSVTELTAAPYAVTIMLLAAVPNLVVAAWFARRRGGPDMPVLTT